MKQLALTTTSQPLFKFSQSVMAPGCISKHWQIIVIHYVKLAKTVIAYNIWRLRLRSWLSHHVCRRCSRKKTLGVGRGGAGPLNFPSPPLFPTPFPSLPLPPINFSSHPCPSFPSPPFPFLSPYPFLFSDPFLPLPFPLSFPPLRSRPPYIQLGGLGKRCKLPQRGLGQSPSRNRIWCILALKSDIWWQQF